MTGVTPVCDMRGERLVDDEELQENLNNSHMEQAERCSISAGFRRLGNLGNLQAGRNFLGDARFLIRNLSLNRSPELFGPIAIHARPLDKEEKASTEQQNPRGDQHGLQGEVRPKILADVQLPGLMFYRIVHQGMKKINAVTHASNVCDHPVAEDCRAKLSAERSQVEKDNHERQNQVS